MEEVPFPAVSFEANKLDSRESNFWRASQNFLVRALDVVLFDCRGIKKKADQEQCDTRTENLRSYFMPLVDKVVQVLFQRSYENYDLKLDDRMALQVCYMSFPPMGKGGYRALNTIMAQMSQANNTLLGVNDIVDLASSIFRFSLQKTAAIAQNFFARKNLAELYRESSSSIRTCSSNMLKASQDTRATVYALVASQGLTAPKVTLGALLNVNFTSNVKDYNYEDNFEALDIVRNSMETVEDFLLRELPVTREFMYDYFDTASTSQRQFRKECFNFKWNMCKSRNITYTQSSCCVGAEKINTDYGKVLQVLKYALEPHSWDVEEEEDDKDIRLFVFNTWLNYYHNFTKDTLLQQMVEPVIYRSKAMGAQSTKDTLINSCSFYRTFSSRGISYTFNAESFCRCSKKTLH